MIVRLLEPRDDHPAGAIVSYGVQMAAELIARHIAEEFVPEPKAPAPSKKPIVVRDEKRSPNMEPADADFAAEKES